MMSRLSALESVQVLRFLTYGSVASAIISAFVLYAINYDTRRIASDTDNVSREIEKLHRDIAVLKAERALLTSPQRIEPYARKLGFEPIRGAQLRDLVVDGVASRRAPAREAR